jgi:hypothetical protein
MTDSTLLRPLSLAALVRTTLGAVVAGLLTVPVHAPSAHAAQPVPEHGGRLVADTPSAGMPNITDGEIWDIEVVPALNRVFVAGSFTSLANTTGGDRAPISQAGLASYNYETGLIDATFRPRFDGAVTAVEATPDGTKLFVGGDFNAVNEVGRQKVARLTLNTGAPVKGFDFSGRTNNKVTALAATNSSLYIGGRFTRINGQLRTGLAEVSSTTGEVDLTFDNQLSGGIGVNGALTVPQLKLTHDDSKLLVVHTGRRVDGEERLGMGLIDTATQRLLPWRSRLWDAHLSRVGGVSRIYAADIAPDDSYFVVASGSGGDAPPISDTAVAFPLDAASLSSSDVEPLWVHRAFDSIYSVAVTEHAVYLGGHFSWNESPTSPDPWPGLDNVGYGTGQGLSGYGLGDEVVRRDHLGALHPNTGKALEWNPESNSFEGNKALEATPAGLFVGGDGTRQGGVRTGRVAFYEFEAATPQGQPDTWITSPIEGRVVPSDQPFQVVGHAAASIADGGVEEVQVEIRDRDTGLYLQDDRTTWGPTNDLLATLDAGTSSRPWALSVTIAGNRRLEITARTMAANGGVDTTTALKKIESFGLDDQTPTTSISGPGRTQASTSFTVTGTADDDHGVTALSYWFRDSQNRYLQDDGTADHVFNSFRGTPDVIGATSATWSYDVTLPHEGEWRASATAIDTAGQSDLRSALRDFLVDPAAVAPAVTIEQPAPMNPPFAAPTLRVESGSPLELSGTAADDDGLRNVEITLRNLTTGENLAADGTWARGVTSRPHRISPADIDATTYHWSYRTPFDLSPGRYSFTVRATDDEDLTTASSMRGNLVIRAQVAGDAPPQGLLTGSTTSAVRITSPDLDLRGTATDDKGVRKVEVEVFDNASGRYVQDDRTVSPAFNRIDAKLRRGRNGTTKWRLKLVLPAAGDYSVTAHAVDTAGQQDISTAGAVARYSFWPGDNPPGFVNALGQPVSGTVFKEGRIVVTGRAEDDARLARVEVSIRNAAGRYMDARGRFLGSSPVWRKAFLNSPGSPASNFSFTTPVLPMGTYTVRVRATDHRGQLSRARRSTGIVVRHPSNNPPVARAAVSCDQNACVFDGRASTDENGPTLTYSWKYGAGQGRGSGPVPSKTFTAPGTHNVRLTVQDEWLETSSTRLRVRIDEPDGNRAPVPTFVVDCRGRVCQASSAGTTDPDRGDVIAYRWNWGDGKATSTNGTTSAHTYRSAGTYTIKLRAMDGWGNRAAKSRRITVAR